MNAGSPRQPAGSAGDTSAPVGDTVSHYRIVERLGGGGMGVVYKAVDTRLNRTVALKFMSRDLTRDADANLRFRQEARAASALDHPNICNIHEIDETPHGQTFLAMSYYEGETIKQRIERGPAAVLEAIRVAAQIAQGLAKAHTIGIIHRDIKPANLIVTKDGIVKILDFGIAKTLGQPDLTRTGMVVGTAAYMAPEQLSGDDIDHRVDLWALGVVLFEMLAGRLPFGGENDATQLSAILTEESPPLGQIREGVPPQLERLVSRLLRKRREERYTTAAELSNDLASCELAVREHAQAAINVSAMRRRRMWQMAAAVTILLIGSAGIRQWMSNAASDRARRTLVPEIARLASADNFAAAYALAEEAERSIPTDPLLLELWPAFSAKATIQTTPPGADVYVRKYPAAGDEWQFVGKTPLQNIRFPRGHFEWKAQKEGFEPLTFAAANPSDLLKNFTLPGPARPLYDLSLVPRGEVPAGMVVVPAGRGPINLSGFGVFMTTTLERFFIDRFEVRNREFKEFVDAGGYTTPSHWSGLEFKKDGHDLAWSEAIALMVDKTGRPGPAGWELSDYPREQDDYPVSGISWYEAAGYCAFREKALPTVYHVAHAATSWDATPVLIPLSNFTGLGVAPAGKYAGIGPYGTFDMFGNVREWIWNASGANRWTLGGAWDEAPYQATQPNSLPPFDRSSTNGFRCVEHEEDARPAELLTRPIDVTVTDYRSAKPVSDELRNAFARQFAYETGELAARIEWTNETHKEYTRQRISVDGGYGERLPMHLFLPKKATPPYRTVVYFPGANAFQNPGSSDKMLTAFPGPEEFVVKSGLGLAWPIYDRSYERWQPPAGLSGAAGRRHNLMIHAHRRQDLGRTVDYLRTRSDIRSDELVYFGFSQGAGPAFFLVALENRFKAAILLSGGIQRAGLPEVLALNYAPLLKMPVLMLNGKYDHVYPVETSVKPLFDHLGTPAADKRLVTFEAGHYPLPRIEWIPQAIEWIDKYVPATRASPVQSSRR